MGGRKCIWCLLKPPVSYVSFFSFPKRNKSSGCKRYWLWGANDAHELFLLIYTPTRMLNNINKEKVNSFPKWRERCLPNKAWYTFTALIACYIATAPVPLQWIVLLNITRPVTSIHNTENWIRCCGWGTFKIWHENSGWLACQFSLDGSMALITAMHTSTRIACSRATYILMIYPHHCDTSIHVILEYFCELNPYLELGWHC